MWYVLLRNFLIDISMCNNEVLKYEWTNIEKNFANNKPSHKNQIEKDQFKEKLNNLKTVPYPTLQDLRGKQLDNIKKAIKDKERKSERRSRSE
ncbi:hypothetical protein RFI_05005 [Reticulomyxa filosa]|uniref:Uncharacterized protein n=1 Tax=Reticulomyxa filosa TaxID=46433 RepID=X6P1U8_RETFI|nr:hypothetical protein RFI_05005 [Reticulomyxa filosa]|eukprot:ETO32113.1 hypothetical protein RFI_05005 [Reticulomyxa filosa]